MHSAMVTFNGRITLPTSVRKQLGLKTGDKIEFVEMENGRYALCAVPTDSTVDSITGAEEGVPAFAFGHVGS
jgi:AbrB family looped-hinge helix DNA binding protein